MSSFASTSTSSHGTADRKLPFEAIATRLQEKTLIADHTLVPAQDRPQTIGWTRCDHANAALMEFLGNGRATTR
jgi:hypothetical protein